MKVKLKVDGKEINVDVDKSKVTCDSAGTKFELYVKQELCKTWDEFEQLKPTTGCGILPNKYLAAYKLEQLRNHYNGGSGMNHEAVIYKQEGKIQVEDSSKIGDDFLNFKSLKLAKQFSENFKDLIIEAGDLI